MEVRPVAPLLSLALAVALAGGCAQGRESAPVGPESAGPQRIILISLDTVRADHLGVYGYDRPTSPTIDHFAKSAVVFEDVVAQASSTLPSHASIFTSQIPRHHGASFTGKSALAEGLPTLAGRLRDAGYRTVAFTGGGQMDRRFGLDRGFDEYHESQRNQNFRHTVGLGLDWLRQHRQERVFLFLHTYQPHHPYTAVRDLPRFEMGYEGSLPPTISLDLLREINSGEREIDERDLQHIVNAYDADLRATDEGFRRLRRFLRRQRFFDEALVVLTSDHGEEFGEHGTVGWHGHTVYEELLRVPLIIKLPGNAHAGTRVRSSVRSLDIAPTILDYAGLPVPETFQGVSLRAHISGDAAAGDLPALSELDGVPDTVSYREGSWKLNEGRLFDLDADPLESRDVASAETVRAQELDRALEDWLDLRPPPSPEHVELESSTLEQLRALGYLTRDEQP